MKKPLAVLAAIALGAGLALVGLAPANAWHLIVTSDVKCASTTAATITWHVANPENEIGTVTASTDGIVPVNTTIPANGSSDFTQAITGPGTYDLSVTITWPSDAEQPAQKGSITVDKAAFDACYVAPPVITPTECESTSTLPTSTNLNQRGWVLKPGTAEYVEGGVKLTSINWDGGKVTLATNFPLSEVGSVAIDYTQGPGSGSVALLFNTSDGNQIHYEPFVGYTHPWFADEVGVFPLGGGGQGSDWSAPDLSTLVSNPTITSVVIGVWGGDSDVVTVHSATFHCATQPFDFEKAVVVVPPVKVVPPVTETLAYTGGNVATGLIPWGAALLLLGAGGLALKRKFAKL